MNKVAMEVYKDTLTYDWMARIHFQAALRVTAEYLKEYEGRSLSQRERNIKLFVTTIAKKALDRAVEARVELNRLGDQIGIVDHQRIPEDESVNETAKQYRYLKRLAQDDVTRFRHQREWGQV